jgi:hypothetical protein
MIANLNQLEIEFVLAIIAHFVILELKWLWVYLTNRVDQRSK